MVCWASVELSSCRADSCRDTISSDLLQGTGSYQFQPFLRSADLLLQIGGLSCQHGFHCLGMSFQFAELGLVCAVTRRQACAQPQT